ncbi:MAG: type IV pilus modification PilV family protein [Acidithiobacillales bacterium]
MKKLLSAPHPTRRRGSTLIEVLVAMAILSIMVAGILQLFSLALLASSGAAARTELLFKCQQVVENIRFCYALTRRSPALPVPPGAGVPSPMVAGTYDLPYKSTDAGYAYWGPGGANVIEEDSGAFKISYTIERSSGSVNALWIVTVTAIPTDDPAAARRFFGIGLRGFKRVDYVAAF